MSLGSLRAQLLYPLGAAPGVGDEDLRAILGRCGLARALERLDGDLGAVRRWDEELSVGEQQRISVARLLAQRPAFAIVDEVTSANDAGHEAAMYECIRETCEAFVSVGHRETIRRFHVRRLQLLGETEGGRWVVEDL